MTNELLTFLSGGAFAAILTAIYNFRKLPSEVRKTAQESGNLVVDSAEKVVRMQGEQLTIVVDERDELKERVLALEEKFQDLANFIYFNSTQYTFPDEFIDILRR